MENFIKFTRLGYLLIQPGYYTITCQNLTGEKICLAACPTDNSVNLTWIFLAVHSLENYVCNIYA